MDLIELRDLLLAVPALNRQMVSVEVDTLLLAKMIRQFERGIADALDALDALLEAEEEAAAV